LADEEREEKAWKKGAREEMIPYPYVCPPLRAKKENY
jgi:hypothetical protein